MPRVDKILLTSSDQSLSPTLKQALQKHSEYKNSFLQHETDFVAALNILSVETFDLIIVDAEENKLSAIEMLINLRAQVAKTPVILLNSAGYEKTAVHCLSHGAQYYLVKEANWLAEFPLIVEMVMMENHRQKNQLARLTHLERENESLKKSAILDETTLFYTAHHFQALLSRELKRASRYGHHLACLILEVNNPTDKINAEIGLLLKAIVRSCDIWAKLSDQQFVALLPHSNAKATKLAVRRLKSEMNGSAGDGQLRWGFAQYVKTEINNEAEFLAKAQSAIE